MQRKSNGNALLSPQKAANLLRANERNLAVKVKAGKTLSVAELNLLQTIESGVRPESLTYARNQQDLATALGINRKTITRYARRPGAPVRRADGRYDVAAWRVFLASAGVESIQDQEHDTNHTELRTRQILLKNERLETQLAILRGEHVPAVEVERWGAELGAAIRKVVSQIHLIAPSVVGMSVAAAEARLKDLEDELLQQLHVLPQQLAQFTDGK